MANVFPTITETASHKEPFCCNPACEKHKEMVNAAAVSLALVDENGEFTVMVHRLKVYRDYGGAKVEGLFCTSCFQVIQLCGL